VSSLALYVGVVVHYPTLLFIALHWRCLRSTHDPPHEQLLVRLGMGVSFLVPLHPPFSLATYNSNSDPYTIEQHMMYFA
jgi:hypothetical protein